MRDRQPAEMVPDSGASKARSGQRYVIAAIGDSLTDRRSHGGGYLRYIAERCPESTIANFGKGGDMVNQMRRRLPAALANGRRSYSHLVVFGGVNDLYSDLTAGRTPTKIGRDLSAMYELARARGMKVVALTVAPWGGFSRYYNERRAAATREINSWIRERGPEGNVDHVVDAWALLSCGNAERLCPKYAEPFKDGLHFGPKGHERLGQALYEAVFSDCR